VIVVDGSVAVEALLGGPPARDGLGSNTAFAPHLIDVEVVHALRGLVRGGHLDADSGRQMVETWPRLGVVRFAMHPLAGRMWELRHNLTAYDASYVALAEQLGCPLWTADERLARTPGVRCVVAVLEP
jgi:predicted nucleic acid-binding protein